MKNIKFYSYILCGTSLVSPAAFAQDGTSLSALKEELKALQSAYESRIQSLEENIRILQDKQNTSTSQARAHEQAPAPSATARRRILDNTFNPSIGVILNGTYKTFSSESGELAGFAIGEEGERGTEGLSLGESEINFSAAIDDRFEGSLTAALVREDGEDHIELEEAYVGTQGGVLPYGLNLKAGRSFWTFGYLNEHHAHSDDFADRPLVYRAYLNKSFNDDGLQMSWVLPTDFYSEVGAGAFRGDDFPAGGADGDGNGAYSVYGRVGGDIGTRQSWRLGAYRLSSDIGERSANEDTVHFRGKSDLYAVDLRYTFAPTGNPREREITLQGEYFYRDEDGHYEDTEAATGNVAFNDQSAGWYAQGVYKFHPQWRVGARYSQLLSADTPAGLVGSALDADGFNPSSLSAMVDWSHSEFSRVRLQLNHEELSRGVEDTQAIVQYTMSLGAHSAHAY